MQTIGERIRHLREARELSQQDLAVLTGLQRGNISHYERNKVKPSAEAIVQLASVLGVTSDWLLTGRQAISPEAGAAVGSAHRQDLHLLHSPAEQASGQGKTVPSLQSGEDLGESERAELLLFSEFLRYRQQRSSSQRPPERTGGSEVECGELIREAGSAYLPVFSWATDASPVLPDAVWEGFVPLDTPHSTSRCLAVRMESGDLLAAGIAAGDLLVVSYRERPAPGEAALLRVGNKTVIGEWPADGLTPMRDRHGQAESESATDKDGSPVLIGRIVRVEKTNRTGSKHDGE